VADFRDEWTQNPFIKYPTTFHLNLNKRLEKVVLQNADLIISVSEPLIQGFKRLVKRDVQSFQVITNGYDKSDFQIDHVTSANKDHRFTICYTGTFYELESLVSLFKAISELIKEGKISASEIKYIHVGKKIPFDYKFEDEVVESICWVDHKTAIQYMCNSDVLLLPGVGRKGAYSGKIFEYMASARPILAVVPKDGVAAELILRTRTGIVVDPGNIGQIKESIFVLYNQWKDGKISYKPDYSEINKYNRHYLTQRLANSFETLIDKSEINI
jgi:glycosyltransferase involved in cell wall biosynthesis